MVYKLLSSSQFLKSFSNNKKLKDNNKVIFKFNLYNKNDLTSFKFTQMYTILSRILFNLNMINMPCYDRMMKNIFLC